MKAFVRRRYGSPEVLECIDMPVPVPGNGEVLVRVRAAGINPIDWHFMRGEPHAIRVVTGLRAPKEIRLGFETSGVVEAVGSGVTGISPGDEVFGSCHGGLAELLCTPASNLVLKPANISFEEAASVPVAALTALQGLRDKARLQPRQAVLINGASGGVGTFAAQIAVSLGARVTAVCSTRNLDLVRSLGAAEAIDYTVEDFTKRGARYDVMFDCHAERSFGAVRRILNPAGTYVGVGGPVSSSAGMLADLAAEVALSLFVSQKRVTFMTKPNHDDLAFLADLLGRGALKPVLDRQYPFADTPGAIRYLEAGHARGKVVIVMATPGESR